MFWEITTEVYQLRAVLFFYIGSLSLIIDREIKNWVSYFFSEDCFISAIGYMLPPDTSKSPSQMGATSLKDFRNMKSLKPMSSHEVRDKLSCPHKSEYYVTEEPNNRPGRNRARTKLTQLIEWTPWNYIGITLVAGLILILTSKYMFTCHLLPICTCPKIESKYGALDGFETHCTGLKNYIICWKPVKQNEGRLKIRIGEIECETIE